MTRRISFVWVVVVGFFHGDNCSTLKLRLILEPICVRVRPIASSPPPPCLKLGWWNCANNGLGLPLHVKCILFICLMIMHSKYSNNVFDKTPIKWVMDPYSTVRLSTVDLQTHIYFLIMHVTVYLFIRGFIVVTFNAKMYNFLSIFWILIDNKGGSRIRFRLDDINGTVHRHSSQRHTT